MLRARVHPLWILVVVYLVLRGLMLLTSFDQHAMPVYELSPAGIVAELASSGWRGAPLYAYYDNCGGHLIVGLLAAPIYKVLGSSYLSLKLVPLLLGVVDLLLIWDLTRRLFGRRAAWVASLAFTLGPQTLLVYSVLAKGNHFEGLTLQWLTAWLWVRGFQSAAPRRWWLLAALVAGFSVFFYFGSLLWIVLLLVTHVLARGVRRSALDLGLGVVPFVLGIAPVLWLELETGRPSQMFWTYVREFRPLDRLQVVLADVLPRSAGFAGTEPLPGEVADWLFLLLFVFVWGTMVVAFLRGATPEEDEGRPGLGRFALLPFLAYLPLFLVVYALTTPRFDSYPGPIGEGQFRYLVPHFAFSCVLLGAFAAWAWRGRRPWGLAVAVAPIFLGAVFALPRIHWSHEHFGEGLRYPGYDYTAVARVLLRHSTRDELSQRMNWNAAEIGAELQVFELEHQQRIAVGLGLEMSRAQAFERGLDSGRGLDVERILLAVPEHLHDEACRGIGAGLVEFEVFKRSLTSTLSDIERTHPELASRVVEGMTSAIEGGLTVTTPRSLYRSRDLAPLLPPNLVEPWLRGQGMYCGGLMARDLPNDMENIRVLLGYLEPEELEPFWIGAEEGWDGAPTRRRGRLFTDARHDIEEAQRNASRASGRLEMQ